MSRAVSRNEQQQQPTSRAVNKPQRSHNKHTATATAVAVVDAQSELEEEEEDEADQEGDDMSDGEGGGFAVGDDDDDDEEEEDAAEDTETAMTGVSEHPPISSAKQAKLKAAQAAKVRAYSESFAKRGVCYMSSIPPFMGHTKLRQLLQAHCGTAQLHRIFLQAEDQKSTNMRTKSGGSKASKSLDGWIEFEHKRDAKRVAAMLNTQAIGGKKRHRYYDDIWNIKYLSGFKWSHLTEKLQHERAVRSSRVREEMKAAREETNQTLMAVDQAKQLEKKQLRMDRAIAAGAAPRVVDESRPVLHRQFKQRDLIATGSS